MFGKKFKNYFVINGPYQIQVGQQVEIDEQQAKRRKHVSKHVKDDVYECTFPFQFKAGEIFGFSGEINKKFAHIIVDPEAEEKDNDVLLEKLNGMSKGQLKYYARVNCDGMKLTKDQDEKEMVDLITEHLGSNEEKPENKKGRPSKKAPVDEKSDEGVKNADTT